MWYQSQLLLKDRQEQIERQAEEARMHRLAGRGRTPAKPSRIRFLNRR
jgi:hypothetical protein